MQIRIINSNRLTAMMRLLEESLLSLFYAQTRRCVIEIGQQQALCGGGLDWPQQSDTLTSTALFIKQPPQRSGILYRIPSLVLAQTGKDRSAHGVPPDLALGLLAGRVSPESEGEG